MPCEYITAQDMQEGFKNPKIQELIKIAEFWAERNKDTVLQETDKHFRVELVSALWQGAVYVNIKVNSLYKPQYGDSVTYHRIIFEYIRDFYISLGYVVEHGYRDITYSITWKNR